MKRPILAALLCVALGFTACTEGPRPLRMCAEWEPALGSTTTSPPKTARAAARTFLGLLLMGSLVFRSLLR